MLVAVGDALGVVPVRVGVSPLLAVHRVDVAVRPPGLGRQAPGQGDLQGPFQQPGPFPAQDGGGHGLQDRHRGLGRGSRVLTAAQVPHDAGQAPDGIAFAQPAVGCAPHLERVLDRAGGCFRPVEQRQLGGQVIMEGRARGGAGPGGEPQRPLELRDRLPVRRELGRPAQPAREQLVDGRRGGADRGASSSRASTRAPVRAATSTSWRASALSPAARDSTASRAESGTSAIPACRTSVT